MEYIAITVQLSFWQRVQLALALFVARLRPTLGPDDMARQIANPPSLRL